MSFSGFWKAIGLGLAKVGVAAGKGALWASAHPDVITEVTSITGHPAIGASVNAVGGAIATVASTIAARKTPPTPGA